MSLNIQQLSSELQTIYEQYETQAAQYKEEAVCGPGCSHCCKVAGKIDIITLEGLAMLKAMRALPAAVIKTIRKNIEKDKLLRSKGKKLPCPFLDDAGSCHIYDARPFSCRQLYSLQQCADNGPLVHREAVTLAKTVVQKLQQLDNTGYSGHHSFIFAMLTNKKFHTTYTSGDFNPGSIEKFGRKHGIIINRFAEAGRQSLPK